MNNKGASDVVRIEKIVSGGQTGVDRAALDAAMAAGVGAGGWCPKGRKAEDGPIDAHYPLVETPSEEYHVRTTWNVRDSDGTLVLARGAPAGGTAFTIEEAQRLNRPLLVVDPDRDSPARARRWIREHDIRTLNVAGPRGNAGGSIYASAYAFLTRILQR